MDFWLLQLLLAIIAALVYRYYIIGKRRKLPPGPTPLPILGNVLDLQRLNPNHPHLALAKLAEQYGDIFYLKVGVHPLAVISSLQAIQDILPLEETSERYEFPFVRDRSFGKKLGVIWSDGKEWIEMRRYMLRKLREFGLGKRDQMDGIITDELSELLSKMKGIINDSEQKNLVPGGGAIFHMNCYFAASVVNCLWRMMVGKRYNLENQRVKRILDLNFKVVDCIALNNPCVTFPYLSKLFPEMSGYAQQQRVFTELQDFMKEVIQEGKIKLKDAQEPNSFMDYFLREIEQNKNDPASYFTEEQLIVILKDMFLGGSETSSHTLSFSVYFMVLNQHVQKKVQAEIDEIVPNGMPPSLNDLPRMPYTQATMLEIFRLGLVIPLPGARVAAEAFTYKGYYVPKGTCVSFNLYCVFQSKELWGDPEIFRPERFLDDQNKIINTNKLPAFGMGKRNCSGESLARSTFFHYFVTLLQHFTLEPVPGKYPSSKVKPSSHTLAPLPFDVIIKNRK